MSRAITSAFRAELSAGTVRYRLFLEIALTTGYIRYWTGARDVTWNSLTWLAGHMWKGIGKISEDSEDKSAGLEIRLAGEPSALISTILQNVQQGRLGKLYVGFVNSAGAIIADPHLIFVGRLDTAELEDDANEATITLVFESVTAALDKPNELRYTNACQTQMFPGDRGFEFMEQLVDGVDVYWGKPKKKK